MNEQMSDTGIVMQMISVARQRPRKTITTSTTKMKAYMIVSESDPMASVISSEASKMSSIFTSFGSDFWIAGRRDWISWTMFTVLAPDCFWKITRTPRWPLTRSSIVAFSSVSRISATSVRCTVRPPAFETTTRRNSSESLNSPSALMLKVLLPTSIVPLGMLTFSAAMICPSCSTESP